MEGKKTDEIFLISDVFASRKRVLLMFMLKENYLGYVRLSNLMSKLVKIGSSEMYKHLHMLEKYGMIVKQDRKFILTKKGLTAVECIEKIIDAEPAKPNIKVVWE